MMNPTIFVLIIAVLFDEEAVGLSPDSACTPPNILCGVLSDEKVGKDFDSLVKEYFAGNELDTEYLDDFTKKYNPTLIGSRNDSIRIALLGLAKETLKKFNADHDRKVKEGSYRMHRTLGAIECVAKMLPHHGNFQSMCIGVINAALKPAKIPTRRKVKTLIQAVSQLKDKGLQKSVLQLIARSGWSSETNPPVLDSIVEISFVMINKNLSKSLSLLVGNIDELLGRSSDLGDLQQNVEEKTASFFSDLERVAGTLPVLVFASPSPRAQIAGETVPKQFDSIAKEYFSKNEFGATGVKLAELEINDDVKSKLFEIAKKAIDQFGSNPLNYYLHRALGLIELVKLFPNDYKKFMPFLVDREIDSKTLGDLVGVLEGLRELKKGSSLTPALTLIGRCSWTLDVKAEVTCLQKLIEYLDMVIVMVRVNQTERVQGLMETLLIEIERKFKDYFEEVSAQVPDISVLVRADFKNILFSSPVKVDTESTGVDKTSG